MRKKIDIADLRPGMYVSELDRPWTETPFIFQGFTIDSEAQIEELRRYCDYVLVDEPTSRAGLADRKIELELFKKTARNALHARAEPQPVPLEHELSFATRHYRDFQEVTNRIFADGRLGRHLDIAPVQDAVQTSVESLLRNPDALLYLAQLGNRSPETAAHSLRVAILALAFGHHLKLPHHSLVTLGVGALLHDLGMARLPQTLLANRESPSLADHRALEQHVALGGEMASGIRGLPQDALDVVLMHHERHDGAGYPRGTAKPRSLLAQITAVANHYDMLTSDASSHPLSPHAALLRLYTLRDTMFEGVMVERFTQCIGIYPVGSVVEFNTGHVGVVAAINRGRFLRPRVALMLDNQGRRYAPAKIIDLAHDLRDETSRAWEIKSVLSPGALGFNPATALETPNLVDLNGAI